METIFKFANRALRLSNWVHMSYFQKSIDKPFKCSSFGENMRKKRRAFQGVRVRDPSILGVIERLRDIVKRSVRV